MSDVSSVSSPAPSRVSRLMPIKPHQNVTETSTVTHASIEWLCTEHRLDDPFMDLFQTRPSTTTTHPGNDIDCILTYGIPVTGISIMDPDIPTTSDHLGICLDVNLELLFSSTYSDLGSLPKRKLALENVRAKASYKHINNIFYGTFSYITYGKKSMTYTKSPHRTPSMTNMKQASITSTTQLPPFS